MDGKISPILLEKGEIIDCYLPQFLPLEYYDGTEIRPIPTRMTELG
ncbi:6745_t:CDS:1, partial [Ambispora leptoticha]